MHGWGLLKVSLEPLGQGFESDYTQIQVGAWPAFFKRSFAVTGGTELSESGHRPVALVGIQMQLTELRGRTQTDGQDAGCQGVQRSRVSGFFCLEEPFDFLQSLIARQPQGFVEQKDPVDGVAFDAFFGCAFDF